LFLSPICVNLAFVVCSYSLVRAFIKDGIWTWSPGNTPNPPRPRFNSCRSEPRSSAWISETGTSDLCSSVFSSTPSLVTSVVTATSNSVLTNGNTESVSEIRNSLSPLRSLENGSTGNYLTTVTSTTSSSLNGNVCSTIYSTSSTAISTTTTTTTASSIISLTDKPPMIPNDARSTNYRDQPASSASPPTRDKLRAEDKARRRMNQQGERTGGIIGDATGPASGEKLGRYIKWGTISPYWRGDSYGWYRTLTSPWLWLHRTSAWYLYVSALYSLQYEE